MEILESSTKPLILQMIIIDENYENHDFYKGHKVGTYVPQVM